jgi:uncharacterized protein
MRHLLVCVHDASPAYARATRMILRDLAPLLGRRFSFGVVPDWHGQWPLAAHRDYCGLIHESSEELLLHGYFHRRGRGRGPITLLTAGNDEMNGLDPDETRVLVECGQGVITEMFGEPARGFIAPAWQGGHVQLTPGNTLGLQYVLRYFSLESRTARIPLATWSWHCGRWGWLGHIGHGIGWLLHTMSRAVPVLAIHPSDLELGFWPNILRLTQDLLDAGYEPRTPSQLLEASDVEIAA